MVNILKILLCASSQQITQECLTIQANGDPPRHNTEAVATI